LEEVRFTLVGEENRSATFDAGGLSTIKSIDHSSVLWSYGSSYSAGSIFESAILLASDK
jgi:hypothetical protein